MGGEPPVFRRDFPGRRRGLARMLSRPARADFMSFDDARHCERLTRRHARTFYLASLLLPGDKRRGAYSLYAFCRLADDLVDCPAPGPGQPTLVRQLDTYRR